MGFLIGIRNENVRQHLIKTISKDWGNNGLSAVTKYLTEPNITFEKLMDIDDVPRKWREVCYEKYEIVMWLEYNEDIDYDVGVIPGILLNEFLTKFCTKIPRMTGVETPDEFIEMSQKIKENVDKYPICIIYDEG